MNWIITTHCLLVPTASNTSECLRIAMQGNPQNPPLLYLPIAHSWPQLHAADSVFMPLNDTYLLISFDPRGVGGSSRLEASSNATESAEDLVRVAEYVTRWCGVDSVYAFGESTGVPLLVHAARIKPSVFRHVALMGGEFNATTHYRLLHKHAASVWSIPVAWFDYLPSLIRISLILIRTPFFKCHKVWWCNGEFYNPRTYAGSWFYPSGTLMWMQAGVSMLKMLPAVCHPDSQLTHADSFPTKVAILYGRHDIGSETTAYVENAFRELRAVRKSLHWIEDAGHAAQLDQPDEFRRVMREIRNSDRFDATCQTDTT